MSLTERMSSATALLEELRTMRAERIKQFADIRSEIEKITAEIAGRSYGYDGSPRTRAGEVEEHDLTIRRLNEHKARLTSLQKEKVRLCFLVLVPKLLNLRMGPLAGWLKNSFQIRKCN